MIVPFSIELVSFGSIVVNGSEYKSDIIIAQKEIISDWWRKESHHLIPEDLEMINWEKVNSVFIGTGFSNRMEVDIKTRKLFESFDIPYVIIRTPVAVKEYNRYIHSNKVGIFHITC